MKNNIDCSPAFKKQDCQLFQKYVNGESWNNIPQADKAAFKSIWERLKLIVEKLLNESDTKIELSNFTSHYVPNGRTPKEIWCCVFPKQNSNKSYSLQIALILSSRGAEICFCQGSGTSQISDPQKKRSLEDSFYSMRERLNNIPSSLISKIENSQKKKWFYRKSWLTEPNLSDVPSLSDWLKYAASEGGKGSSISCYLTPSELETTGENINNLFKEALMTYEPLLACIYESDNNEEFNENEQLSCSPIGRSLIRATATKPFIILTGNSGTGKTYLAEALAATYRNHDQIEKAINLATVPVGADWTDSRAVVGFVNHLRSGQLEGSETEQPIYQSTAVVDLLLSADTEKEVPHFLILDEMNLSHVERYFADFLSAMESREGRLRLHDEGPRNEENFRLPRFDGDPVGVPRSLAYPRNLFVIGTVNIDETTYMFSPKVLDRAHVIEFIVDRDDIAAFLENPVDQKQPSKAGDAEARAFLELSRNAKSRSLDTLPKDVSEAVNRHLMDCLDLLQRGRFEFAYRTTKEIQRYMRVCHHLAKDKDEWKSNDPLTQEKRKAGHSNWLSDLDDEVLQKILPRLHGSRNRIGPLIGALTCYMHSGDVETAKAYFTEGGSEIAEKSISDLEFAELKMEDAKFPRSFQKLKTMAGILVEEQFVSFIC